MKAYFLWGICAGLVLSIAFCGRAGAQAPATPGVRIVSPLNNQLVPLGDVSIQIATDNFTLEGTNHWLLYVDGKLLGPIQGGATITTTQLLESGPHQIEAVLADTQHSNLASTTIFVTAFPETPTQSPFNLPWTAAAMGVLFIGVLALLFIGLRISHRPVE